MNYTELKSLSRRPQLFAPGTHNFWADPFLGSHFVWAHLEDNDDGSRPQQQREAEMAWIHSQATKNLRQPGLCLDLGCGPGLYALELARQGWKVEGWDCNSHAVDFAQEWAKDEGLEEVIFRSKDLVIEPLPSQQDLILMVYGGLGTLEPSVAKTLLQRCAQALKPGGMLMFDTFTETYIRGVWTQKDAPWASFPQGGFWSDDPYLLLTRRFTYSGKNTWLRQFTVVQQEAVKNFRLWYYAHTPETLASLMPTGGGLELYSSLQGEVYQPQSPWLAAVWTKNYE